MKFDLAFRTPLLNAAGSLGFSPNLRGLVDFARFGAFVTHPLSLDARTPAHGTRYAAFPGGFLLHTGYPNPGLRAGLRHYAARWANAPLPVVVHILCTRPPEAKEMVSRLENLEGVMGIELGLPPEADKGTAEALIGAAIGELPVIARVPFERAQELALAAMRAGAAAVSLGPPRGVLGAAGGGTVRGRLYGPALFPQALGLVAGLKNAGVPVIGAGGVYQSNQVEAMLAAGALAVQLDAVLWRAGLTPLPEPTNSSS